MAVIPENKEVIQAGNFTEAQIKGAGTPQVLVGEFFFATDTKKIIYRQADNGDANDWLEFDQYDADRIAGLNTI